MALQKPAGLGTSPMTQKTSPPVGNKKQKVEKMPKRGAVPKVVDPRDEVMKLVAKRLKQDKTSVGIASPTAPMPTEIPAPMTTALGAPPVPPKKMEEEQLLSPTPIMAAKGKSIESGDKPSKKGKGLAVVIDMGSSDKPEYEEASMGTPADPPPGATSDEVKDNQHVLLSEGELVVPANVVRYHGLGMYEGLRRDALQGLGEMEDAGQVEYMDDEVKTAAAGMTIMNAQPNVATMAGIQKQQGQYNPALGQYGTAAAPEAASAKFVNTSAGGKFTDTNKDGIDDKLQPSINKGIASPVSTGAITPAALKLGPTTNPNTVVGAGNVGSYVANQSGIPGSGDDNATPIDNNIAPTRIAPVVQQQNSGDDGGDPEINAGLGGARTTIGGVDYAIQYDFSGNITGLANVADALSTGRSNYLAPNPELMDLISKQTAGQRALATAAFAPVANAFGFLEDNKQVIEAGKVATAALNAYRDNTGMRPQDMPLGRPTQDVINAYATEGNKISPNAIAAPEVKTTQVDASSGILSPEIEIFRGREGLLNDNRLNDLMSSPLYQSYYDTYTTQFTEGMGATGAATTTPVTYSENMNTLNNIINRTDITPQQRLAAQHASQDLQMDAISRSASSQADAEREFNVDETFGSGRNPDPDAMSAKEQREAQQKGVALGFAASTVAPGTSTNQALGNKGYSDTGAAPSGSQYSSTGTFSTGSDNDDDNSPVGDSGSQPEAPVVDERTPDDIVTGDTSRTYSDDTSGNPGGKSIVCTEMYRQTQRDDWAQAMKTWYIYQKKYLTPIHEIGYHSLFKPFVRGMKVNKALTNLGAYLAKERTKHLRHILTKGKSADSIVGNIFCKIIHPIVYLVGLAVHKK